MIGVHDQAVVSRLRQKLGSFLLAPQMAETNMSVIGMTRFSY